MPPSLVLLLCPETTGTSSPPLVTPLPPWLPLWLLLLLMLVIN